MSWHFTISDAFFRQSIQEISNKLLHSICMIRMLLMAVVVWLSWWSCCFQYQRSAVWIQSSAKICLYWTFVYCQLCIEKTKIKKKRQEMVHFAKKRMLLILLPKRSFIVSTQIFFLNSFSIFSSFIIFFFLFLFNIIYIFLLFHFFLFIYAVGTIL